MATHVNLLTTFVTANPNEGHPVLKNGPEIGVIHMKIADMNKLSNSKRHVSYTSYTSVLDERTWQYILLFPSFYLGTYDLRTN